MASLLTLFGRPEKSEVLGPAVSNPEITQTRPQQLGDPVSQPVPGLGARRRQSSPHSMGAVGGVGRNGTGTGVCWRGGRGACLAPLPQSLWVTGQHAAGTSLLRKGQFWGWRQMAAAPPSGSPSECTRGHHKSSRWRLPEVPSRPRCISLKCS